MNANIRYHRRAAFAHTGASSEVTLISVTPPFLIFFVGLMGSSRNSTIKIGGKKDLWSFYQSAFLWTFGLRALTTSDHWFEAISQTEEVASHDVRVMATVRARADPGRWDVELINEQIHTGNAFLYPPSFQWPSPTRGEVASERTACSNHHHMKKSLHTTLPFLP